MALNDQSALLPALWHPGIDSLICGPKPLGFRQDSCQFLCLPDVVYTDCATLLSGLLQVVASLPRHVCVSADLQAFASWPAMQYELQILRSHTAEFASWLYIHR